jgi:hypothetical protein
MNTEELNENLFRCRFVYRVLHMVSAAKFAGRLSVNRSVKKNGSRLLTMKCVFVTDLEETRYVMDTRIRNGKHTCGFNKYRLLRREYKRYGRLYAILLELEVNILLFAPTCNICDGLCVAHWLCRS